MQEDLGTSLGGGAGTAVNVEQGWRKGPRLKVSAWAKSFSLQTMLLYHLCSYSHGHLASPFLPSSFPLSLGILFQAGPQ